MSVLWFLLIVGRRSISMCGTESARAQPSPWSQQWSDEARARVNESARKRDAADVTMSTAFGPALLVRFKLITDAFKDVG